MKHSLCCRHCQQRRHLASSAGLAEDRHRVRISAELRDVLAHPFERVNDIEDSDVTGLRKLGSAEVAKKCEAEYIDAMIDRDHDHVAATREMCAFSHRRGTGT